MKAKLLILSSLIISSLSVNVQAQDKKQYGNNVLAISPIQITNQGVGLGLSFETKLDKDGVITLTLPLVTSFNTIRDGYYTPTTRRYNTYFFMPGIKFYPTGSKKKVSYALGPNLAIVAGKRPMYYNNYIYPYPNGAVLEDRFSLGTMLFNYLDINPTEHLYLGLEMGMGVAYIDQTAGKESGMMPFLFQLGFKLGYRF